MSNKTLAGNVLRSRLVQRNKPKKVAAESARTQTAPVAASSTSSATTSAASTPKRAPAKKPASKPSRKPSPSKRGPSRGKPGGKGGKNKKMRPRPQGNLLPRAIQMSQVANVTGPTPPTKTLKVIPLGGMEEIGRNCMIIEYDKDIIIVDMGLQFPEEDMPGIDYIIPNISYLKGKEKNVKAVIFSHGHLDHIGAAPFLLDRLGYPPVVARDLTLALIKHKQEDYQNGSGKFLKTIRVNNLKDTMSFGKFKVSFFQVEHSIMDSMGVVIQTPEGTAIHPGDWTMERDAQGKTNLRYDHLASLPSPKVLLLESLGALSTKRHGTYEEMYNNLYHILSDAPGRIIIGTFSSQVERVKWVIYAASKLGKKVALDGYSMKLNVEIAKKLGYIKEPKGVLIDIKDINKFKDNEVVVICTGAQGEERAVLNRIVSKTHRQLELRKNDTVIFSSSIIPGNERTIQKLKDNIYRQCDNVIHGDVMDVHISGHSTRQDIVDMIKQVKPDYYIPVFANHFFLKEAKNLAIKEAGFSEKRIFVPDNGSVMDLGKRGLTIQRQKANTDYVFVDGLGVTDMQHVVLRDRQVLAEEGMVVVIATVDTKTGRVLQNPDIISRGFVYLKENTSLIEELREKVKKMVTLSDPKSWADTNQIKNDIRDKIGQFLFSKTEKRPMILPVVIEV